MEALPGAREAIALGAVPGGLKNNKEFASCSVELGSAVSPETETLLYDPQTSGGLLIAITAEHAGQLQAELREQGVPAAVIGTVIERGASPIYVS